MTNWVYISEPGVASYKSEKVTKQVNIWLITAALLQEPII